MPRKKSTTKEDRKITALLLHLRKLVPSWEFVDGEVNEEYEGTLPPEDQMEYQPVVPGTLHMKSNGIYSYLFYAGEDNKYMPRKRKPTISDLVKAAHEAGAKVSFGLEPKDCCFPDHAKHRHCGKPATWLFKCYPKHAGHLLCEEHLPAAKKLYAKWPEWSCAPV